MKMPHRLTRFCRPRWLAVAFFAALFPASQLSGYTREMRRRIFPARRDHLGLFSGSWTNITRPTLTMHGTLDTATLAFLDVNLNNEPTALAWLDALALTASATDSQPWKRNNAREPRAQFPFVPFARNESARVLRSATRSSSMRT